MVKFCYMVRSGAPIHTTIGWTRKAESIGFESAGFIDRMNLFPKSRVLYECWSVLSVLAMNTGKVRLGPIVTEPHRRHPAETAHIVATLDHFSNGRAILMIGSGERINTVPFGINYEHPVEKLREAIEVVRLLFSSSPDNPVDYQGEFFSLNRAYLQVSPIQKPTIPIYISGWGPKSLQVAGEVADGWFPLVETPETFGKALEKVKSHATNKGRNFDDFDGGCVVRLIVSKNREEARKRLPSVGMFLVDSPKAAAEAGFYIDVPRDLTLTRMLATDEYLARYDEAASKVPFEALDAFTAWGTPDDCIGKIERYIKNGAKLIVIQDFSLDLNESLGLLGDHILPYFLR